MRYSKDYPLIKKIINLKPLNYYLLLLGFISTNIMASPITIDDTESVNAGNTISTNGDDITITETGVLILPDIKDDCVYEVDATQMNFLNNGKVESDANTGRYFVHYRVGGDFNFVNNGPIDLNGSNQEIIFATDSVSKDLSINIDNKNYIKANGPYLFNLQTSNTTALNINLNNSEQAKIDAGMGGVFYTTNDASVVNINNAGEITAKTTAIESYGQNIIHNSGKISGETDAIIMGDNDDQLQLETTSVIVGDVKAGGGDDTLTLLGETGTGVLDTKYQYSDFEYLDKKQSNTWLIKGDEITLTKGTSVKAGALLIADSDSKLNSNVSVDSGATFGGYGSLNGDLMNNGTLAIASAAPGMSDGEMSSFTIDGDYTGNNGQLIMNMALNGDTDSPGSRLIITGDTAGTTNVTINNVGGLGAKTIEGIEVIEVGGNSDGVFTQNGRIVAGAYDYTLVKGNSASDKNWYLTSDLALVPDPEPTPEPTPEPKAAPVRPEAGSYLGNQSAAKAMFISTMHDRIGEQHLTQSLPTDDVMPSTWIRTSGSRTEGRSAGSIDQQTYTSMFQLGNDLTSWTSNGHDRMHVGFMFGSGYAKTDSYSATSKSGARHSTGKVHGYNTGLYGTWYADAKSMAGLYVDSSLQYSWFNNETKGEQLNTEKYDSDVLQASLETGYVYKAIENGDKSLYLEPQAQMIYSRMNNDDFAETNGTRIHGADADGFTTRLGARIFGRVIKNRSIIEPFIEANWWHETAANSIQMNEQKVYDDIPSSRYEIKGGFEGGITNNLHSWVNAGFQTGKNDYSQITGMAGLKYIW
ncbi:autotransporter outer membrane beta-barrel domain-containing protein [Enterobacter vonholyi]|uniref:autotransporter family protein n=1 Tax=Enterobacter vonholyi TaxID=2797505 RepID=UPI001058F055|nr:autotransporter outer membrane beta-barrel domain-containing protein [Enterobacter cloacae complex sp.]